ncbi:hypothetical protein PIB30_098551, partial [Stylosanthes scabra]|nr:hypothetical protein [Stylosanthes scabra]
VHMGVSSVTCAHSDMIQSSLTWGSLLQSSLLQSSLLQSHSLQQSSTMQMSRGAGTERGELHRVALVDVFSYPHLGVEDDI